MGNGAQECPIASLDRALDAAKKAFGELSFCYQGDESAKAKMESFRALVAQLPVMAEEFEREVTANAAERDAWYERLRSTPERTQCAELWELLNKDLDKYNRVLSLSLLSKIVLTELLGLGVPSEENGAVNIEIELGKWKSYTIVKRVLEKWGWDPESVRPEIRSILSALGSDTINPDTNRLAIEYGLVESSRLCYSLTPFGKTVAEWLKRCSEEQQAAS